MTEPSRFRPGRSPFDDIVHVEGDGTVWWGAREMMPHLGYRQWHNMLSVIERARMSCRNVGIDHESIFTDAGKYSEVIHQVEFASQTGSRLVVLPGRGETPGIAGLSTQPI